MFTTLTYRIFAYINTFKRINGSCDLEMIKGCKNFNFEVKFKENDNIQISRLYDYLDGFSLLPINSFLRENHFEINLNTSVSIMSISSAVNPKSSRLAY